ncbi:cysteine proteinase inhibitor 5-like [Manihot esculenta]|uniref:Cystatin domain-containing protein n=1 Tax=Manihot esculenta TaxID=3983 RepID=A0A2C9W7W4_MANES|nr:cysteine proteinase inhibitor 5-like [Manihot esculenta]OAY55433.1 hypothetical protein MANES_03G153900v8 [Manihot esculenta]
MKGHRLIFSFLFFAAVAFAALVGGWQPIKDLKDPNIVEIGEYAVKEYNKRANTDLILVNVVKGEEQVVSGMNYRLILAVTEGKASKKYQAEVWEKAWENFKNLTSFEPVKE